MKIMQILNSYGMGGVEKIVIMLHRYYLTKGLESYILVNENMYDKFVSNFGISQNEKKNIIVFNSKSALSILFELKKNVIKFRPNIIHTHARKECFFVSLLPKRFIHIRTFHMILPEKYKTTKFEKYILKKNIDKWISVSELNKEYIKKYYCINDKKIEVIYNGVFDDDIKRDFNVRTNKFCIVSRISYQKGIDILINEINKFKNELKSKIYIDIYGDGPDKEKIVDKIKNNGLDTQIRYKGTTRNLKKIVLNYDALLMPSRYEGLPFALLEAMSTKTPVASHDVGCIKEIINNKKNGWIIDKNYNWETFFNDFYKNSMNYMDICNRAYKTYKEKFEAEKMLNSYFKVLRSFN